jgi:hypothetical protein
MQQNTNEIFPRELTSREKNWLFAALPENKPGYQQYRSIIDGLVAIGKGRFGDGNLILGEEGDSYDSETPSTPIFAIANIEFEEAKIYITIHEESERQVEVDIKSVSGENIPENLHQIKIWTYSTWSPGQKAPFDNADVHEIQLIFNKIVLVIAPTHKKIWVYNDDSGINHFVPITNYYNELMIIMNDKNPETALNPARLFDNLNEFSDDQLVQGFLAYNKHWNRIELDHNLFEKKKPFFKF